ncbi:MAG TPA: LamG-like jellyroll fold domain-containing protein [Hanamia sp.]|nr:LamG-like jellyroll fold domain-containing protein [Hanamia sp.]
MKNYTKAIRFALTALFLGIITQNVNAQNNTLDFDGVNDSVTIPYNVKHSQILSIQFAVKVNANTGSYQTILTSAGNFTGYTFYVASDGTLQLFLGNGANWVIAQGPAITAGVWTNIAAVYNGSAKTITLYVNGLPVTGTPTSINLVGNATFPMKLGGGEAGTVATPFGGQIDELRLWGKQLTPAEITTGITTGLTGTEANLLGYYNFNEGIGNGDNLTPPSPNPVNTLTDLTGNHLDGTLYNFALTGNTSNWVTSDLVLPINLINFSGSKKGGSNLLQWSTASEQNSSYFEVQRSENSIDFSTIAKVNAAGNSSQVRNYQYNDDEISSAASIYYYRLKMVDIDGSGKYSSVIFIKNSTGALTTVYPNPARDQVTINVADKSLINTQVLLSGLNGKVLQRILLNQTSTQVNISNYAKGMYILKFADGSSIKIVKE